MVARSQVVMSAPGGWAICVRCRNSQLLFWKYCQYQCPRTASITGFIGSGAVAIWPWRSAISAAGSPWITPFSTIFRQMALVASAQA